MKNRIENKLQHLLDLRLRSEQYKNSKKLLKVSLHYIHIIRVIYYLETHSTIQ